MNTVDQYRLIEKIGNGSQCEVYKALDPSGHTVAIKKLKMSLSNDSDSILRFEREAKILQSLNNQRVVRYLNFFMDRDNVPNIVQEFIQGKTLKILLQEIPNNLGLIVYGPILVSEILLGLEEVHQLGFVHRDLKPENIMINDDGFVKIMDFGLAKNVESLDVTQNGMIVGSPQYMSPEQFQGQELNAQSDLFSLGIMLYQMCTGGRFPFWGENFSIISSQLLSGEFSLPETHNPFIHRQLSSIIQKSLAQDLRHRYQNAFEMRHDLLKYIFDVKKVYVQYMVKTFFQRDMKFEEEWKTLIFEKMQSEYRNALQKREFRQVKELEKVLFKLNPTYDLKKENIKGYSRVQFPFTDILEFSDKGLIIALIFLFSFNVQSPVHISSEKKMDRMQQSQKNPSREIPKNTQIQIMKKPQMKSLTGIEFEVPNDVEVFVDDIPMHGQSFYATAAGIHRIRLMKKNHSPIETNVEVQNNKVTKINVNSNESKQ